MQVFVHAESFTPRLTYALKLVLGNLLGHEPICIADQTRFERAEGIKINYTGRLIEGALQVVPHTLLFEEGTGASMPEVNHWSGIPVLFSRHAPSNLPFDPFAAAFWMAARYEEYQPFTPDRHGRFCSSQSLAHRHGFLDIPVVHIWAAKLADALAQKFPGFEPRYGSFTYLPTIDVDLAYTYLHRGWIRTSAAVTRDLLQGRFDRLRERRQVVQGRMKDPYDQYEALMGLHNAHKLNPTWFFLAGSYGRYDPNINTGNPGFVSLIKSIGSACEIGMHPSYGSGSSQKRLKEEKAGLEAILGKPVRRSRQHFLKLSFPLTYQNLVACGIEEDYSMGFNDQPGFRAGLCKPYPWFDLSANRVMPLTVFPFQAMDVTLAQYLRLPAREALDTCIKLVAKTKEVHGTFSTIWHNQPSDPYTTSEWFELYWQLIHYICT